MGRGGAVGIGEGALGRRKRGCHFTQAIVRLPAVAQMASATGIRGSRWRLAQRGRKKTFCQQWGLPPFLPIAHGIVVVRAQLGLEGHPDPLPSPCAPPFWQGRRGRSSPPAWQHNTHNNGFSPELPIVRVFFKSSLPASFFLRSCRPERKCQEEAGVSQCECRTCFAAWHSLTRCPRGI